MTGSSKATAKLVRMQLQAHRERIAELEAMVELLQTEITVLRNPGVLEARRRLARAEERAAEMEQRAMDKLAKQRAEDRARSKAMP